MMAKLTYEVVADRLYPNNWRVEAIDTEAIFVALFSGPEAENRARDYAAWKNAH